MRQLSGGRANQITSPLTSTKQVMGIKAALTSASEHRHISRSAFKSKRLRASDEIKTEARLGEAHIISKFNQFNIQPTLKKNKNK